MRSEYGSDPVRFLGEGGWGVDHGGGVASFEIGRRADERGDDAAREKRGDDGH
jgi:hypothetical protein